MRKDVRFETKTLTGRERQSFTQNQMDFESIELAASEAEGGGKMSMQENKD